MLVKQHLGAQDKSPTSAKQAKADNRAGKQ